MEAELNKYSIDRYKADFSTCFSREETAETVVPDVLPDIARIIDTDACVFLRGKEAVDGSATVSGSLECTVIYLPDREPGLRRLNITIPFNATVDSPEIEEGCSMVAKLSLNSVDARMLNPRKVLVRADVCVCLSCYSRSSLELTKDISGDHGVQTLRKTAAVSVVRDVNEKTFVLSDEYQISPSKPPVGELLKYRVTVLADDANSVGNKLVFKGTARFSLLYASSEDGRPVSEEFSTNFSQLLEMEGNSEAAVTELVVMPTGAYLEPKTTSYGTDVLNVELHLVAQAVRRENTELVYVADAYCCTCAGQVNTEVTDMEHVERELVLRETAKELVETSEPVREIVNVNSFLGQPAVENGKVTAPLNVQVLYTTESGGTASVSRKLNAETHAELEPGTELHVTDMRCADIYASPAAGGLELRLPVEIKALVTTKVALESVTGMDLDPESPAASAGRPSVIVVNADGNDIWSLAKKYLSTPALIKAANPELPTKGTLLIPLAR